MRAKGIFRWTRKFGSLAILLILLISLAGESIGSAAPQPQEEPPIQSAPEPVDAWIIDDASVVGELRASMKNSKLDSSLAELASEVGRSEEALALFAESRGLRLSEGRVQVHITTSEADLESALAAVDQSGGEVTVVGRDQSMFQAWLPVDALESLTEFESVYFVRQPMEAVLMGDMQVGDSDTEAIAAMNADVWHTKGFTGNGVRVAVIDGGFDGYLGLLGSDLPATVTVKNFVDLESDSQVDGTTPHGTACAEIVHDIAPNAQLFLGKISTNLDLQQAVAWAITQNVDIISTSMGWYNLTPGDGTGEFEDLVQDAEDAGILWLTAASNDRENHWGGLYNDNNSDNLHDYSDGNINYFLYGDGVALFPTNYLIRIFLRWDDWVTVNQDYDLILYRNIYSSTDGWKGWTEVASSTNPQNDNPGQTPTEYISYKTSVASAAYGFVIERVSSSRVVNFEVFTPKVTPQKFVDYNRSLSNLADASTAMTVAALDTSDPYLQEEYSSQGPTNGLGGTLTGGFTKPDISGFANVSTESYGTGVFNGTSSATPHAAGAAALVLDAYPGYSTGQIQGFLETRAVEMGVPGMDSVYGFGRLWLGTPPSTVVLDKLNYMPLIMKPYPFPGVPSLFVIANADMDGNYTVSWSSTANTTGYILQEDDNTNFTSPTEVYEGASTSKAFSGKAPGTYYYRVKAVNNHHESSWSNIRMVKVGSSIPGTPVLFAIDNADGNGSYTVDWNKTANTTGYILQEDTNSSFSSPTTVYQGVNDYKAIVGKAAGTYYYRVRAYNNTNQSAWSNTRSATVKPTLPQPTQPPPPPSKATVYVKNSTGGRLCYEVRNTGIGEKCWASNGTYLYGSFPAGTYTYHASARCGSITKSVYFAVGTTTHSFWCQ